MWQKFAESAPFIELYDLPAGKKVLFMGGEIAQWNEWNCKREIEWFLLDFPTHQGIHRMVKDINHFYMHHPALWEKDFHYETFEWVDFADMQNSVISYLREGATMKNFFACIILLLSTILNMSSIQTLWSTLKNSLIPMQNSMADQAN